MERSPSCSWFDDTAARMKRLSSTEAREGAQMVVAATVVGQRLCIEQMQCSVTIGIGRLEATFAGVEQLGNLKWVLCGARSEATGSGGATLCVERGSHGVGIVLQRAGDMRRCQLLLAEWDRLRKGDLCNAMTDALSCRGGSPIIADPAV